jgi:CBS domain-containing protein
MKVEEVMTPSVECARPGDSIATAAARMRDLDVGSLPVCGEDDKLAGMLTDRDITVRSTADCCNPAETPVRDAMTPEIVYCLSDQDINDAAALMKQNQIRRLPVLDQEKRLVGIVTLGDLANYVDDEQIAGDTLRAISSPTGGKDVPLG